MCIEKRYERRLMCRLIKGTSADDVRYRDKNYSIDGAVGDDDHTLPKTSGMPYRMKYKHSVRHDVSRPSVSDRDTSRQDATNRVPLNSSMLAPVSVITRARDRDLWRRRKAPASEAR